MISFDIFLFLIFIWGIICTSIVFIIVHKMTISKNQWVLVFIGTIIGSLLFITIDIGKNIEKSYKYRLIKPNFTQKPDTVILGSVDKTQLLLESIMEVESKQDSLAKNKSGASGILQIMPQSVIEANRIIGKKKFNQASRYNIRESLEMFKLIQNKYNPQLDIEKAIRLWNGGPKFNKIATDAYFRQVKAIYDKKCDGKIAQIVKNVKSLTL